MKKGLLLSAFMALGLVFALQTQSYAACSGGAGSICIVLQDELATSLVGDPNIDVQVIAPGPDGVIGGTDAIYGVVDGLDGGSEDADSAADGEFEVSAALLAGNIANGQQFRINVLASGSGYTSVVSTSAFAQFTYNSATSNQQTAISASGAGGLQFNVKIVLQDQLGNPLETAAPNGPGFSAAQITATVAGTSTVCDAAHNDGGGADEDGLNSNSTIYLKCAASSTGVAMQVNVTAVSATAEMVESQNATYVLSSNGQAKAYSNNVYPVRIVVENEVGNSVSTATIVNNAIGGAPVVTTAAVAVGATGTYFMALPNGTAGLLATVSATGYVTAAAVDTTPAAQSAATAVGSSAILVDLSDNDGGDELVFSLVIDPATVEDELGNALTLSASDTVKIYTDNACTTLDATVAAQFGSNGSGITNGWFIPAAVSATTGVKYARKGFVPRCENGGNNVTGAAQVTAGFTVADTDPLLYGIKVTGGAAGVEDADVGGPITLTGGAAEYFTVCTAANCSTTDSSSVRNFNAGTWYIAPGVTTGSVFPRLTKVGYVTTTDTDAVAVSDYSDFAAGAQQTTTFVGADALPHTLMLVLKDQLGTAITASSVNLLSFGGAAPATTTQNIAYWAAATSTAKSFQVSEAGYVNVEVTNTGLANVQPIDTSQTEVPLGTGAALTGGGPYNGVVAARGLEFTVKIGTLESEAAVALTQASGDTLTLFTNAACTTGAAFDAGPTFDSGSNTWYAGAATGTVYIKYLKDGYRATCSGAIAAAGATAQVTQNYDDAGGDGLIYNIRVDSVQDELGNTLTEIAGDTLTIYTNNTCTTSASITPVFDNTATATWKFPATTSGSPTYYLKYYKQGFVPECEATGVTPDGVSIWTADFTSAGTDGLPYAIKVTGGAGNIETEAGVALTLTGTGAPLDHVLVCTDAPCSATDGGAARVFSGGSWYVAPSVAQMVYVQLTKVGYVQTVDADGVDLTSAPTTQTSVKYTAAQGDSVPYQVRAFVTNEEGTAMDIVTLSVVTFNGAVTTTSATNSAYWAAATGAVAVAFNIRETGFLYSQVTNDDGSSTQGLNSILNDDESAQVFVNMGDNVAVAGTNLNGTIAARGMEYSVYVQTVEDQTSGGLTQLSTDTVDAYTNSTCTISAGATVEFDATDDIWRIAAVNGTYYVGYQQDGYLEGCSPAVTANVAVQNPVGAELLDSAGDGLVTNGRIMDVDDELDVDGWGAQTAAHSVGVFTDAACTAAAAGITPVFDGGGTTPTNSWHIPAPVGGSGPNYYVKYTAQGYVPQCHLTTLTATGLAQQTVNYDDTTNNLQFGVTLDELDVSADETGDAVNLTATNESVRVCTASDCSSADASARKVYNGGTYYIAPSASGTYYIELTKAGYITTIDSTGLTNSDILAGAQQTAALDTDGVDAVPYNLKVFFKDELQNDVLPSDLLGFGTLTYDETVAGGASTPTNPDSTDDGTFAAWWAAATGTAGSLDIGFTGVVDAQVTNTGLASVLPTGTTQTVITLGGGANAALGGTNITGAQNAKGIEYALKVVLANELGTQYNVPGTGVDPEVDSLSFDGSGPDDDNGSNTAYFASTANGILHIGEAGYVDSEVTNAGLQSIDLTNSDTDGQTVVTLGNNAALATVTVGSALNAAKGLEFGTKVTVKDEFGALPNGLLADSIVMNGQAAAVASVGTGIFYFTSTAGAITHQLAGYADAYKAAGFNAQLATVNPGGGVGQTNVTLNGQAADCNGGASVAAGQTVSCGGLRYNLSIAVCGPDTDAVACTTGGDATDGITNLGSLVNFYMFQSGGTRVQDTGTGLLFFQEDADGVYKFGVATQPTPVAYFQVKDVDNDGDPYIDFIDSDLTNVSVSDTTSVAAYFVEVDPAPDALTLTGSAAWTAGATETLTVGILDNDGNPVTTGASSTLAVTIAVTLQGGGNPAGIDISGTSLTSATSVAGASDLTVTGNLVAGAGTVDIVGTKVENVTVTVVWEGGNLPQDNAANQTVDATIGHAAGDSIVMTNPTDVTVDNTTNVTLTIYDAYGNVATTDNATAFTLNESGNATIDGTPNSKILTVTAGTVTAVLADQTPETVNLTLTDHAVTGLNVTSAQNAVFSHGAATQIVVVNPTDATTDDTVSVTFNVLDQYNNLTTSNSTTQFAVNLTNNAKVKDATTGTLLSGANTNSGLVRVAGGTAVVRVTDTTVETTVISVVETPDTGLNDASTQNLVFSQGSLASISIALSAAEVDLGGSVTATVTALDAGGNTATARTDVITITSDDAAAVIDAPEAMVAGVAAFNVTLNTSGTKSITASVAGALVPDDSENVVVNPPSLDVALSDADIDAGDEILVTVSAKNPDGAVMTNRTDDITLSINDSLGTIDPGDTVAMTAGVATFTVTLFKADATDYTPTVTTSIAGGLAADVESTVTVNALTLSSAVFTGLTPAQIADYFVLVGSASGATLDAPADVAVDDSITGFSPTNAITKVVATIQTVAKSILEYTTTDADDLSLQIFGNGTTPGLITAVLYDKFGNIAANQRVDLIYLGCAGCENARQASVATLTDSTADDAVLETKQTDSNGQVTFSVTSTLKGSPTFAVRLAKSDGTQIGDIGASLIALVYKANDTTPPLFSDATGTLASDSLTPSTGLYAALPILQDGDFIPASLTTPKFAILVNVQEQGTNGGNASGFDTADWDGHFTVAIVSGGTGKGRAARGLERGSSRNASVAANLTGKVECSLGSGGAAGIGPYNCLLYPTLAASLTAGPYLVSVNSIDLNGQTSTVQYNVQVGNTADGTSQQITDVVHGPNPFDPTGAQPLLITFQSANAPASVRYRIYDRSGREIRMVVVDATTLDAGYNELSWNGQDNQGLIVGEGIYFYRLEIDGQTFKGKVAVDKP